MMNINDDCSVVTFEYKFIYAQYIKNTYKYSYFTQDMWQDHADKGTTFNVFDYSSLYTLDILLRCAFSDSDSNCLAEK